MAVELGQHRIRVNAIAPAVVETPLTAPWLATEADRRKRSAFYPAAPRRPARGRRGRRGLLRVRRGGVGVGRRPPRVRRRGHDERPLPLPDAGQPGRRLTERCRDRRRWRPTSPPPSSSSSRSTSGISTAPSSSTGASDSSSWAGRAASPTVTWEGHRLFLDERPRHEPPAAPQANVRVMVPDVDAWWRRATGMGARVLAPIADRYYGLRDFTIADPDGFGIRFAHTHRRARRRICHGAAGRPRRRRRRHRRREHRLLRRARGPPRRRGRPRAPGRRRLRPDRGLHPLPLRQPARGALRRRELADAPALEQGGRRRERLPPERLPVHRAADPGPDPREERGAHAGDGRAHRGAGRRRA